jgi:hypothetical protein
LPQQDPGPAQPAWAGLEPQQAVSPAPGKERFRPPLSELVADMSLRAFRPPQEGQTKGEAESMTNNSPVNPQSGQLIS